MHDKKFIKKQNRGDKRDRTADPLLAKQVLSQLSYVPVSIIDRKTKLAKKWANLESNQGPQRYQHCALTN
jgi:hypothetical protein